MLLQGVQRLKVPGSVGRMPMCVKMDSVNRESPEVYHRWLSTRSSMPR